MNESRQRNRDVARTEEVRATEKSTEKRKRERKESEQKRRNWEDGLRKSGVDPERHTMANLSAADAAAEVEVERKKRRSEEMPSKGASDPSFRTPSPLMA